MVNVGPLAINGVYTLLLFQQSDGPYLYGPQAGSIVVTPTVATQGSLTAGTATTVPLTAGQSFSETVSGTAGEYLSLDYLTSSGSSFRRSRCHLNSVPFRSGAGHRSVCGFLYDRHASRVHRCRQYNVGPLPATGSYEVVFQQTGANGSASGTMSVARYFLRAEL